MKDMEDEIKLRKDRENQIKKIESEINSLKSDINKNLDILNSYDEHKIFLSQLGSYSSHFVGIEDARAAKKAEIKKKWIDFHRKSAVNDAVIFRKDEDSLEETQRYKPRLNFTEMTSAQRREKMTQSDWENKFEAMMADYLIDLPEGFYDEKHGFTDPN